MIPGLPFTWHAPAIIVLVVIAGIFWRFSMSWRLRVEFIAALVASASVLVWPMGNLAQLVSLSATVIQRLVLMLLLAPILLRAAPAAVIERLTRPRALDALADRLSRPLTAIIVVTIVGTLTLTPLAINWAAGSDLGNAVVIVVTFLAGVVLWLPALGVVPGSKHLSPAARAGYIFASALVVTSLSFIWILATKSLYPGLHGQEEILGVTAVFDQQLAGFLAKFGAYLPMWIISFYVFMKADSSDVSVEESPLHWADVERHLLRVDRQREREQRRLGSR